LNDDANGTPQSEVSFTAVAGTTYYVAIGGNHGLQGPTQLHYRIGDPTVSIGDVTVAEQNGSSVVAHVPVTLSHATSLPVTVSFATANKTAKAPGDYTGESGIATVAVGSVN